jgi:hypothetical protein
MSCKICKADYHYCNSCDNILSYDYSVCTKCWSDHGFDIIEERWLEEREELEKKWDTIIFEKIKQRSGE